MAYSYTTPSHIKRDLEAPLMHFSSVAGTLQPVSVINVQAVASYSWIDEKSPTIAVPGSPSIWKGTNPQRVPADSGLVFIDQNAHRMGSSLSPLTPMFAAIVDLGGYDFHTVDIISDRNNLRKLLRWATGVADDFRIDVELAGQTCLFTRTEEKDAEIVRGFKGYGHEYEKAATRLPPGCEKATGHHRIISMEFGNLKILLRFEVDACSSATDTFDDTDLASAFSNLGLTTRAATENVSTLPAAIPGLTIVRTYPRTLAKQTRLIEMKTRAAHRPLDWEEVYPQLYLSQTAYLYLAKHNRGTFTSVEKIELASPSMEVYAKRAQAGMGKLKAVLSEVLEAVRDIGSGAALSLICERGKLTMYRRKVGTDKVLGKDILGMFE